MTNEETKGGRYMPIRAYNLKILLNLSLSWNLELLVN